MTFGERVQWCREHVGELDRNGWAHVIGEPLRAEPLSWYPEQMVRVHRAVDGLTTRLLLFHPYEKLTQGLREDKRRDDIRLGDICYSFPVMLDVEAAELSIWDGDDLMYADEYDDDDDDEAPEPIFKTTDLFGFFDRYVFGERYPELIDRIVGFQRSADAVDEWRQLLQRAS